MERSLIEETPEMTTSTLGAGMKNVDIVGRVGISPAGNSVLEIGKVANPADGWQKVAHVVLTPAERRRLIGALQAQESAMEAG